MKAGRRVVEVDNLKDHCPNDGKVDISDDFVQESKRLILVVVIVILKV